MVPGSRMFQKDAHGPKTSQDFSRGPLLVFRSLLRSADDEARHIVHLLKAVKIDEYQPPLQKTFAASG